MPGFLSILRDVEEEIKMNRVKTALEVAHERQLNAIAVLRISEDLTKSYREALVKADEKVRQEQTRAAVVEDFNKHNNGSGSVSGGPGPKEFAREELAEREWAWVDKPTKPTIYEEGFKDIFDEITALQRRKNNDYGNSWTAMGAKGVFVRLTDKVARLKTQLWDGKDYLVEDEKIKDTAIDLISYSFMLLYALQRGMIDSDVETLPPNTQ